MFSNITRTLCRLYRVKSSPSSVCHGQAVSSISTIRFPANCSKNDNDIPTESVVTPGNSSTSIEELVIQKIRSKHVTLNEDVIKELTGGDAEKVKKLKLIDFEYQIAKQEGKRVPSSFSIEHWKELLAFTTASSRQKFMTFRFKCEQSKINKFQKKENQKIENKLELTTKNKDGYGLGCNSFIMRVYDQIIDHWKNARVIRANMFDQPVVFDFSFHNQMTRTEQKNAVKQLAYALVYNRDHQQPLPMQFCNVDLSSSMFHDFKKLAPTVLNPEYPISVSTSSYLDLFPREKIVYLTPHCNQVLEAYDPDSVYIVGALVDKTTREPLSLAKAKRDGVKMRTLPLDYMSFKGDKLLSLNAMMAILVDMRVEGDWRKVLKRHVPPRKLKTQEELEGEKNLRQLKFGYQKKNDPINTNHFSTSRIEEKDFLFPDLPKRTADQDNPRRSNNRNIQSHSGEMLKKK